MHSIVGELDSGCSRPCPRGTPQFARSSRKSHILHESLWRHPWELFDSSNRRLSNRERVFQVQNGEGFWNMGKDNSPTAKCAARALLSVVRPQILRLWTATMPSTDKKVSCTTVKLMSLGIPKKFPRTLQTLNIWVDSSFNCFKSPADLYLLSIKGLLMRS